MQKGSKGEHLFISAVNDSDCEEQPFSAPPSVTRSRSAEKHDGRGWKSNSMDNARAATRIQEDQSETVLLFCPSADERDSKDDPYDNDSQLSLSISFATIGAILWQLKIPAFSVMFTFVVTIAIFPALIVSLQSTQRCQSSERFYNDLFVPFLFLLYNLSDFTGRVLANHLTCPFTADNVWIASASRIVFVPLFLLCKVSSSQLPLIFNSDACPILFIVLFALSNGYVASCSMMLGAAMITGRDSSLAGTIMVFCLTLGLCLGAVSSFLVVFISQGAVVDR